MSNRVERKDSLALHPKNLSLLVRGKQGLLVDMAVELSKMHGTGMRYRLNLQNVYGAVLFFALVRFCI